MTKGGVHEVRTGERPRCHSPAAKAGRTCSPVLTPGRPPRCPMTISRKDVGDQEGHPSGGRSPARNVARGSMGAYGATAGGNKLNGRRVSTRSGREGRNPYRRGSRGRTFPGGGGRTAHTLHGFCGRTEEALRTCRAPRGAYRRHHRSHAGRQERAGARDRENEDAGEKGGGGGGGAV
ncbi:hypothetical protein TYRP_016910 [Tyrophagus putrescentiae]|nr:hypothetical protein TYRP_016910 [Tyrophagus putrescentiae]